MRNEVTNGVTARKESSIRFWGTIASDSYDFSMRLQRPEFSGQQQTRETIDSPDVARLIGQLCALFLEKKIDCVLQIGKHTVSINTRKEESRERCTLVFKTMDHFLEAFRGLRIANIGGAFLQENFDVVGNFRAATDAVSALHDPQLSPRERLLLALCNQKSRFRHTPAAPEHYSLPPEAYELFLGPYMQYTCNYHATGSETLAEAERDKLKLIADCVGVVPGGRHLDIGCGWGGLLQYFSEEHGAQVTGITDCETQAHYARDRLTQSGASESDVLVGDFANFNFRNKFDSASAVGCLEHIPPARYPEFFRSIVASLKTGGHVFLQAITRPYEHTQGDGARFLQQHVFPGFHLGTFEQVFCAAYKARLRPEIDGDHSSHYAKTLALWIENLRTNHDAIRAIVPEKTYRTLLAYMAMAERAFRQGDIQLHRWVFSKFDYTLTGEELGTTFEQGQAARRSAWAHNSSSIPVDALVKMRQGPDGASGERENFTRLRRRLDRTFGTLMTRGPMIRTHGPRTGPLRSRIFGALSEAVNKRGWL